jgi:tape measure domain-containing protein
MGYQIDIDVNSDQLELLNEALNTTFSAFRSTIDKLERTMANDAKMKSSIDKYFPGYEQSKRTVNAEDVILKQFEKTGSVKFLNETLKLVSSSITAVAEQIELMGKEVHIDERYLDKIDLLRDTLTSIGKISVAKNPSFELPESQVNIPGDTARSNDLRTALKMRQEMLEVYRDEIKTTPKLDHKAFKRFEEEVQALAAHVALYNKAQNHTLLFNSLLRSEADDVMMSYENFTGKKLTDENKFADANSNLKAHLSDSARLMSEIKYDNLHDDPRLYKKLEGDSKPAVKKTIQNENSDVLDIDVRVVSRKRNANYQAEKSLNNNKANQNLFLPSPEQIALSKKQERENHLVDALNQKPPQVELNLPSLEQDIRLLNDLISSAGTDSFPKLIDQIEKLKGKTLDIPDESTLPTTEFSEPVAFRKRKYHAENTSSEESLPTVEPDYRGIYNTIRTSQQNIEKLSDFLKSVQIPDFWKGESSKITSTPLPEIIKPQGILEGSKTPLSLPPGIKGGEISAFEAGGKLVTLQSAIVKLESTISSLVNLIQKQLPAGAEQRQITGKDQKFLTGKPSYDFDAVAFPPAPTEHNPYQVAKKRLNLLSAQLDEWQQKALPAAQMPPVPTSHNPFRTIPKRILELKASMEEWSDVEGTILPPPPSSHNPFKSIPEKIDELKQQIGWWDVEGIVIPPVPSSHNPLEKLPEELKLLESQLQSWVTADVTLMPPPPSSHNPFLTIPKQIAKLKEELGWWDLEAKTFPPVPSSHNPQQAIQLVNGVLQSASPTTPLTAAPPPPPPPKNPPAPPAAPEPDDDGQKKRGLTENQMFAQAREKVAAMKDRLLREGVGNIGTYRASMSDLFGDNKPKNEEKAQVLVNTSNRWIERQLKIFENASLADAKVAAKLGENKFSELNSSSPEQARKVALARQEAELAQQSQDRRALAGAKRDESESFNAYRRQLEARLKAAMSNTTDNQVALIQEAVSKIKRARQYIQQNEGQFFDKERFGNKGVEVYNLQNLENRGLKKLDSIKNKTESQIETTSLQEMRAGIASIRTFIMDLQTFTNGLIQVSSAMNKEVIKLGVANNNSIAKTEKDIADSTALAKKFGGSVSSYLKDFADIKVADLSQVTQSGSLTPNRFLDSEVKSLVSGLRSAYNVNQLDREAQDGASKAVVQMLSKGKIQAEELRGQLGDRLNGAVTLFAQALGISTAQLDRRLKEGSVMDVEIFKFGRLLERKYAEAAQAPTLIKEATNLSGAAMDIATQGTQPVAGVATVAAQFLNSLTDGIKANAGAMVVATLPIGLALAGGISGSVKEAFMRSSFSSPIITGLGESLRANAKTLGVLGGGLGLATAGSVIFGSAGLDKTILKLGDQIKNLATVVGNFFQGFKDKATESGFGKSNVGKIAFEILPLAALASPITNFAIDKTREMIDNAKEKNAAVQAKEGRKPSLGERIGSAASSLPLLNIGAALAAGAAAYAIANTRFISEYAEVTDRMIKEMRKSKKDESTFDKKVENFRKNEGTQSEFSIDGFILGVTDLINFAKGDLKNVSIAGLEDAINNTSGERNDELRKILDAKLAEGYKPQGNTFAGGAANQQIITEDATIATFVKQIQERFNPSYYADEIKKATPIVNAYREESRRLLEMQNSGNTPQSEIDAQQVKVQTLAVQSRESIPDLLNAQADVTSRIAKLEELKQNILTQDLAGAKERAAGIDSQLAALRVQLPKFLALIQSLSDPNQAISDRKQEIAAREKKIGLERLQDSAGLASDRNNSTISRFYERNEDMTNLRESATAIKAAELNMAKLQEQLSLATEKKNLIANQTSSDTQQQEYEAALKAEAEALNAVSEGTLALTKARLDERKTIEEYLLNAYSRAIRNFSADNSNTNYFDSKKGLQSGILRDTVEFGTVSKAQFALSEYQKILPSLTLNADEAKEKLRELSDQVALATLSFIEQRTTFQTARTVAQLDANTPTAPLRDTFFDRFSTLQRSLQKAQIEQGNNQYLTQQTRTALANVQDPTEKSNLALKLINLETEAIKRKFDVEMAGIELARAAYKRNMDVFQTQLNRQTEGAQSNSQNRGFVEGRRLEDRFAQTNQFGATLTENRQALERLNSAISIQAQNRATNRNAQLQAENFFSQMVPQVPADYKQFLSQRLAGSSAFQINSDLKDIQAQIDLANNSSDTTSMIQTKNLGQVNVQVAEALVKLLSATAQIKQIDQSDSQAVAQARNAYNLSTAAVVRAKRQQDTNNQLAGLDTRNETGNNEGQIRTTLANAKVQADTIRAKNAGLNAPFSSILESAQTDYLEQIRRAEVAIKTAEATRASLKKTQDEMAFGATQVELDANAAILRGEDEKIRRLRVQLRGTQIAGAEKLLNSIAGFSSDLNAIFDTASNKLRESVDLLNRNLAVFRGQGLEGMKNPAVIDTIPVAYTDKNGVVRQREEQSKIPYNPAITGNYETAQLLSEINKIQAEAKTKIALMEYVQKNLPKIQAGGVEGTQQYQDVPELRSALKEIENLVIGAKDLTDATKILDTAIGNLRDSMFTDAERAAIVNRKLTRDRNNDIIYQADTEINSRQAQENRLASGRGMSDVLRILIGAEPRIEEIAAQRKKAKAEYDNSQLSTNPFERERGQTVYKDRINELDDQMNKLPAYGNRLAMAMEEAVANGSKLSSVLSEAITKGDWSHVLQDLLANVMNSLGDKFGNDAAKGLGGLLGGGLQSLFGVSAPAAKSSGDLPSYNMGTLPSYNMGNLPCYADGNLPGDVVAKRGSQYPRTRTQDVREMSTSHLAIIGRDELVGPASEVSAYIDFKRGISASSNVNNTSNSTSSANTYNSYSYSNYQGDGRDTFSRPEIYRKQEEQSRLNRFS